MDWLVEIVNWIFSQVGNVGHSIVEILPDSPLKWTANIDSKILAWVNWLIPMGEMIVVFEGVLICVGAWYLISIILRWINVAGG